LAASLALSGPLLTALAPVGPIHSELGGGASLLGLATLAGAALALASLGRREAFLERAALAARIPMQAVAVVATVLEAVLLTAVGARLLAGWSLPVSPTPFAALRMAGLALPLLALRIPGTARIAIFLAVTWWAPALALSNTGSERGLARALSPIASFSPSESSRLGTMLAPTLLGAAVLLTGALLARSVSRIR